MKRPEQEEFLKSLKIKRSEIEADNFIELIDPKLTTKALYNFLIDQPVIHVTDTDFVETMLLWKKPDWGSFQCDSHCIDRLDNLKTKLNTGAIKNPDKALSYAYLYYTEPKYENCCRTTDELYKLAESLGKSDKLEQLVLYHLIGYRELKRNDKKLMCFKFYQNYMSSNVKDEPLSKAYDGYKDLINILTEKHDDIVKRAENKAKREKIKEQQDTLDMNNVLDTLSDMTPDRLKTAYPYCAVVCSTYSSGWAQDAFQVTTHYYFTNLSKSEIKVYLKERGVNVKDTDSGYYNNGTSNHYEWGGTAQGRRTNSYSFVTANEVPDFKVGEDYEYNSWTAGTMRKSYVHVVAKPKDSGELYHLKARPGKLHFCWNSNKVVKTNIFGETTGECMGVSPFYSDQTDIGKHYFSTLDEFVNEIKKNINNDSVTYNISGHFYIKYGDIETIYVGNQDLSYSVLYVLNNKYNITKVHDNGGGYFHITLDYSGAKYNFIQFIEEARTTGIDTIIPEDETNYILARKDESDVYLIEEGTYITSDIKFHKINKKLFNEVFEK